jgi:hypothetical protein
LGLHEGLPSEEEDASFKRGHPALQNMKNFTIFLLVVFARLDPDPDTKTN